MDHTGLRNCRHVRPDLLSFQGAASALDQLLERLASLDPFWATRTQQEKGKVSSLEMLCSTRLQLAKQATFTDILKEIEEDVLGVYFPLGNPTAGSRSPVIEVYWTIVGAVSRTIDVDVEGLTVTILTHELAHAYSHLGADTATRQRRGLQRAKITNATAIRPCPPEIPSDQMPGK